uniref:S1-like domain-containing protein n=1 Tax=viral metagenome TaxID=1070528 RepID=A0A6C0B6Y2_9ZZZZ
MVKNTKGGKGAKCLARKTATTNFNAGEKLRLVQDEMERYACVTKMFGNGMCEITLNDNQKLVGHIRGAFRGRQKHRNLITIHSIVMVGLREWEDVRKNCDILYIYDDNQLDQLKNIPQIDIKNLLSMKVIFGGSNCEESNIQFSNDTDEETEEILQGVQKFEFEQQEEIDLDDI